MPEIAFNLQIAIVLIMTALSLRFVDYLRYRNSTEILQKMKLVKGDRETSPHKTKRNESFFAIIPFLWLWAEIVGATMVAVHFNHWAGYFVLTVFVGGTLRSLQEVAHTAVHAGLCRSKKLQWFLGNVFFVYPTYKMDMDFRYVMHIKEHHQNANVYNRDPNLIRFYKVGFLPTLSKFGFWWKFFNTFTPGGIYETFSVLAIGLFKGNSSFLSFVGRLIVMTIVAGGFYFAFGWQGLVFGYALPLTTVFPFFSWISVLVEHRWFVHCDKSDKFTEECINGRPTDYSGLSGWFISQFICPLSDRYHLAHSLYPYARWNHLGDIDRALKENDPRYTQYQSHGLIFPDKGLPSALSEVYERMTTNAAQDLSDWSIKEPVAGASPEMPQS